MIGKIKRFLYFPVATYFRIFATIQLAIWHPKIVVVTGSYGKTTLLEMIKAAYGDEAKYSDHANSTYGIPFDILGIRRITLTPGEWVGIFLKAPFLAFKRPYKQKIYIAETDCDRPKEGKFLATLLKPDITLWISSGVTHSMNFDHLVGRGFNSVDKAISKEFGYFAEYAKSLLIANGDSELVTAELKRSNAKVELITMKSFNSYKIFKNSSEFVVNEKKFHFDFLLPRENFYNIAMVDKLMSVLDKKDFTLSGFRLPPGRSSVFAGIKKTTLIDSSYNTTLNSMQAIIDMFDEYPGDKKWAVIGDMLELGKAERDMHEKLAEHILEKSFEKVILMGPRVKKYTYPNLKKKLRKDRLVFYENPKDVLEYLQKEIQGGEIILFKGARFLEGIIEHLLLDKKDAEKLPRREKIWVERRKQWGL